MGFVPEIKYLVSCILYLVSQSLLSASGPRTTCEIGLLKFKLFPVLFYLAYCHYTIIFFILLYCAINIVKFILRHALVLEFCKKNRSDE